MTVQLEQSPKPPRKIRFNFNALAEFEILTGKSALSFDDPGAADIRALAYVGLREADTDFKLSLNEVGALLNTENIREIMEALTHDMSTMNGEKK